MIVVLFGQPNCGKTTLATELSKHLADSEVIDGDRFRELFKNTDYSKEGRMTNLKKACDIAFYLHQNKLKSNIILSMVFPYVEVREYLKSLHPKTHFFFLTYQEPRGRENYHVEDFDYPKAAENAVILDTDKYTIKESIDKIMEVLWDRNGER
jgi:adenylylsulfate kinase-like enzyme